MERKRIGTLGVDSGQIFLVDPAYLEDWQHGDYTEGVEADNSYARVTAFMLAEMQGEVEAGVVVSTPGDGIYPVYATFDDDERLVKIEVMFDGSD